MAKYKEQQQRAASIQNALEQESLAQLDSDVAKGGKGNDQPGDREEFTLLPGHMLVESPVSAKVWELNVKEGDSVKAGQLLMVLEAMKMELSVDASCDCVVKQLLVAEGHMVNIGASVAVVAKIYADQDDKNAASSLASLSVDVGAPKQADSIKALSPKAETPRGRGRRDSFSIIGPSTPHASYSENECSSPEKQRQSLRNLGSSFQE